MVFSSDPFALELAIHYVETVRSVPRDRRLDWVDRRLQVKPGLPIFP